MKISDELLMAYVDGELDREARATIEKAMASDPDLAGRVARQQELRARLRAAFDDVLIEPVPDRLLAAARTAPAGSTTPTDRAVIDLAQARAQKSSGAGAARRWSWPEWGAIAASVLLGVIVAQLYLRSPEVAPFTERDGRLVAQRKLADALTNQLASTQSIESATQVGISFRSQSGDYCRTFVTREGGGLAGLTCREGEDWTLQVLARINSRSNTPTGYRTAAAAMPIAVLQTVEEQITGEPLNADTEAAARRSGWRKD